MNRKIVIEINFNNYGMNPNRLTREWISERLDIFRTFTLRSLLSQINTDFLSVVKLAGGCSDIVEEELARHEPIPDHIRFGTSIESKRRIHAYIEGADELLIARIDSDDLYHQSFVQQLHDYKFQPETVALVNQMGYLWDAVEGQMAPVFHRSPSFYVFRYQVEDFLNDYRVVIPGKGTHGYVTELPHEVIPLRNYVNVIHAANTSVKKVPAKDRLSENEMNAVLAEFLGTDIANS
ncbi:glycosyltransferase family A protein [Paenibacillus jamilae]|uniref:glycosyltransferase family A protein n=1 Tax=Paenibacillus jamilae TaxID=114136 RepID=UPI003D2E92B7